MNDVTGLVLAGGMGRRMDSRDKGLVDFRGKPMAQHALERLAPQVSSIIVNANRNLDEYRALGSAVISDDVSGFAGPLAGLHAGMRACAHGVASGAASNSELIVTVPCDSPFLPLDLVAKLVDSLLHENADIAVAESEGQLQPVFALYKISLLNSLEKFLSDGGRKIDKWYEQHTTVAVNFEDERAFANINTIAELQALQDERALR
jgi:molybdenum cofactor guanylyltransferase